MRTATIKRAGEATFRCLLAQLTLQSDRVRDATSEYLETFDKSYVGSRVTDYKKLSNITG
jgi:hypothetical protein